MTLEDKIYQTLINNPDTYPVKQCEQIADDFAIGFGVWLSMNCEQSNSKDAWWIFKSNWITTDELLVIYKKENQL
jgi:hypothetical protein